MDKLNRSAILSLRKRFENGVFDYTRDAIAQKGIPICHTLVAPGFDELDNFIAVCPFCNVYYARSFVSRNSATLAPHNARFHPRTLSPKSNNSNDKRLVKCLDCSVIMNFSLLIEHFKDCIPVENINM